MNAIVVDDDQMSIEYMKIILGQIDKIDDVKYFLSPKEALKWCENNKPDLAFLDIEMGELSGIFLAGEMNRVTPHTRTIFVTSYDNFALEAFKVHAVGYILKPCKKEDIEEELKYLDFGDGNEKALTCRCFGNFEAYDGTLPIKFKNTKTKELLAYLVHREGATCSVQEIAAVVLPEIDNPYHQQSRLRTLVADLLQVLKDLGFDNCVYKAHGSLAIIPHNIKCDFYDFVKLDKSAIDKYHGEYMNQYPWGADIVSYLDRIANKNQ